MTPAPTLKPIHVQLEEAEKALAEMEQYGPDEEDRTRKVWTNGMLRQWLEVDRLKGLLQEDTECAGCKEIFPLDELDDGVCTDCWKQLAAAEAREER